MNSLNLSGTIQGEPESREHNGLLAARINIIFASESTVTVVALGALAQQICDQYKNGDGIIVTGRLTGKSGNLEIMAEKVAPHRGGIYERRSQVDKRGEREQRFHATPQVFQHVKAPKRKHW